MRVHLGANVVSSNGDKVGSVERLIVDPSTKAISKLVVRQGFLTHHDKLVDIDMVTSETDDGLQLDLTADQVKALPDFVEHHYRVIDNQDYNELPFVVPNAGGGGSYLWGAPYVGRGYEGYQDSFFDPAPSDPPTVVPDSNINDTDVVISEGTDVVGSDGDKLGTVGEVFFTDHGTISGFTVDGGLFKQDMRVPMSWVTETGGDRVTLKITADQARAQDYDAEETTS